MSDSPTPTTAGRRGPMSNFPSSLRRTSDELSAPGDDDCWLSQPPGTTSPSTERWARVWINDCSYPQTPVRHGTLSPLDTARERTAALRPVRRTDWSSPWAIDLRTVEPVRLELTPRTGHDWKSRGPIQIRRIRDYSRSKPSNRDSSPTWSRLALQDRRIADGVQHRSERLVVDPQPPNVSRRSRVE